MQTLRQKLGRLLAPITVWRWRRRDARAIQLTGGAVAAGPFQGMQYIAEAGGSALPPKLIGTYENELHAALQDLIVWLELRDEPLVIDLGAAEGYYAVGLARELPEARVIAYELDENSRELLQALAQRNGVNHRITLHGKANAQELNAALANGTAAIICDVEGAEAFLLDAQSVPELAHCPILVETHDHLEPNITQTLKQRFAVTHDIETLNAVPRCAKDWPTNLGKAQLGLMDELRVYPQHWLWMKPKGGV